MHSGKVKIQHTNLARFLLLPLFFAGMLACANGQQDPGVMTGPYGVPIRVLDDTGVWQIPMKVFANAKVAVYIPDITGLSWAAWHVQRPSPNDFTYFLDVYSYHYESRRTAQELIYVDTRHPNYIVVQTMFQRKRVSLPKNSITAKITDSITALVKNEAARQPSERAAIQNAIQQDENAAAAMSACLDKPPGAPCAPSVKRYPRTQAMMGDLERQAQQRPADENVQEAPASPQITAMAPSDFSTRFGWYVDTIKRTVARNWYSQLADPQASMGHSVVVAFIVHRDGSISDPRITRSSGVPSLDLSAIQAVERINTFGPLPAGYASDSATVSYTFTYDQNTAH